MSYRVIGDQARSLHDAMLSGLKLSDLQQLTRHELNERPGTFRPDGVLSTAVFNLIQWAERQGRVEEMIRAIRRPRPHHQEIQSVTDRVASRLVCIACSPRSPRV
jgi:Effector-associated domain 1